MENVLLFVLINTENYVYVSGDIYLLLFVEGKDLLLCCLSIGRLIGPPTVSFGRGCTYRNEIYHTDFIIKLSSARSVLVRSSNF